MGTTRDLALSIIEDKGRAAGAQIVVTLGGSTICDEGLGEAQPGREMTPDTIQSLFCLTKPLVAAAVCAPAGEHDYSLDDDLRSLSPRLTALDLVHRISLRDVLSHAAGLQQMLAAEVMFAPRANRAKSGREVRFADDWKIGVDHAYSEFQGWNLLRVLIEDTCEDAFGPSLRRALLDPVGLHDIHFGVDDAAWADVRERLGVHYVIEGGPPRPMLHELMRKHLDDPALQTIGGYGSARALAAFYRAALRVLSGQSVPGLP